MVSTIACALDSSANNCVELFQQLLSLINTDGYITLASWESGEIETVLEHIPTDTASNALVYSPDGKSMAAAYQNGVIVIDVALQSVREVIDNPPGEAVARLTFSPDSRRLLLTASLWISRSCD